MSVAKAWAIERTNSLRCLNKLSPAVSNYKNRKMVGFMNNFMIPDLHLNVE